MYKKIKKLIFDPKNNLKKVIPYLNSKFQPLKRKFFEYFNISKYSKPYLGHEKLLEYIKRNKGFFIEIGGNDGYFQDPTYYLEKFMGWKGIIVEPLSISKLCAKNRRKSVVIKKACISPDFKGNTTKFIDCNAMSFVKDSINNSDEWIRLGEEAQKIKHREIEVETTTIQKIIDEYAKEQKIELFVADVEGYELEVLKGLNFEKNPPKYILVEAQNEERLENIKRFLSVKNYLLIENIVEKDYLFKLNG